MTDQPPQLLPETDYLLEKDKAAVGTVLTAYNGGDPLVDPPKFGYPENMQVEIERRMLLEADRTRKMNEGVFLNQQSGWGEIKGFMDNVFKSYKDQNDAKLIKVPKNEQETIAQMEQLQPVRVDPNEVANIRQLAVKLDQQMKAIDPRSSFWTDPRTKGYADWLNRESGPGDVGFMQSGEQELKMGAVGRTAYAAWQGIEGIGSAATSLAAGVGELGRRSILALGGPDVGGSMETNFMVGPDGTQVGNSGKVPSMMDGIVMAYAAATNQNIATYAQESGRAQEHELATRAGFDGLATSVSRLGGELVGMAAPFGAAAQIGKATVGKAAEKTLGALTMKGMQALGTLRLTKGLAESDRALKIVKYLTGAGIGEAAGMAGYESLANGKIEGYGAAYMHGLMMAPVLMTLGQLGKKTEWLAKNRTNMPAAAARAVAGAMEGAGFAGIETVIPDVLPSAWGFIRDPNQSTAESFMKNMLAFALVKAGTGATTGAGEPSPEMMQMRRGIGRAQFAEKVARGEARPEEVAKAPVADEAKLRQLGQASIDARQAPSQQARTAALRTQRRLEAELDAAEMGKGPSEKTYESVKDVAARLKEPELQGPPAPRGEAEAMEQFGRALGEGRSGPYQTKLKGPMGELAQQRLNEDYQRAKDRVESQPSGMTPWYRRGDAEALEKFGRALGEGRSGPYQTKRKGPMGEIVQEQLDKDYARATERVERQPEGLMPKPEQVAGKAPGKVSERGIPDPMEDPGFKDLPAKKQRELMEDYRSGKLPERRAQEGPGRDPLEDPRFNELAPEVQKQIMDAPNTAARVEIFSGATKERRNVPRETSDPTEQFMRGGEAPTEANIQFGHQSNSGVRSGPQSLQMPPTRQVDPTPGAEPVSAKDIFTEMEGRPGKKGFRIPWSSKRIGGTDPDAVRVPMRSGAMPRAGVLGLFRTYENLVRTGEGRDLVVAAHEWSHAMHRHTISERGGADFDIASRDQLARAVQEDPRIASELQEILRDYPGYERLPPGSQGMEVWAEWHARNLLGEVGLDTRFPATSKFMREFVAAPARAGMRAQYQRIQEMLYRYNAQGSEMRVRQSQSIASVETPTQKSASDGPIRKVLSKLNKYLLDDMADLKRSQDKWLEATGRRPEDIGLMEDPARLFDTLRMTASKTVDHFVLDGIRLPGQQKVPGLKSIMDSVKGREKEFQDYVVSLRSLEIYNQGKKVQLPVQDYAETIRRVDARNPDFQQQARNLKRWTDALIDYVAEAQAIGMDDAARIKAAYSIYVPFLRDIPGPKQHGQGRGVAERGTGLGNLQGSTFEIIDPFIKLQDVARSMVSKAHQNQVMGALYKLALGQEGGGLATIVPRKNVPTDHPLARILDLVERKAQIPEDIFDDVTGIFEALREADALNPQTITTFTQKVIPTGERNIIAFTPRLTDAEMAIMSMQGGVPLRDLRAANNKLQWLEVDTKVYESLMGIDTPPMVLPQELMNWVQKPRDLVRFFATGVSPGFVIANAARDILSRPMFDRDGNFNPFSGFVDFWKGAALYHGKDSQTRELYEEMGAKTSSFWTEGRQRALIGEQRSMWGKMTDVADKVQNFFSHSENYLRIAEFKRNYDRAKADGRTEQEARLSALEAGREITVNFARAGVVSRMLNQMVPYFNAGVQGQRKLWGQIFMGGAETKGDANKARIQRAALVNAISNITIPSMALWFMHKDEEWYQDLPEWRKIGYFNTKLFGEVVSIPKPFEAGVVFGGMPQLWADNTFGKNPARMITAFKQILGPYLKLGWSLAPAAIKPLLEVTGNYNSFTGRELTPDWIRRSAPSEEQSTFYTTESAKIVSKVFGGLLSPIEVEHLLGGYTAGASTAAFRMGDNLFNNKPMIEKIMETNPFARFTKQREHGQSSFVDQLYEISTDLDQRRDSLDSREQSKKKQVDTAKRQISDLRKQYRAGTIDRAEAERRSYEIARPIVEENQ